MNGHARGWRTSCFLASRTHLVGNKQQKITLPEPPWNKSKFDQASCSKARELWSGKRSSSKTRSCRNGWYQPTLPLRCEALCIGCPADTQALKKAQPSTPATVVEIPLAVKKTHLCNQSKTRIIPREKNIAKAPVAMKVVDVKDDVHVLELHVQGLELVFNPPINPTCF